MSLNRKQSKKPEFHQNIRLWSPLTIAAIISLLLHLAGLCILPERILKFVQHPNSAQRAPLELTLPSPQVNSLPQQYAEVNPDVVENKPDRADAYSFKDQQAAGESGIDPDSKMPQINGELAARKLVQNERSIQERAHQSELPTLMQLGTQAETSEANAAEGLPSSAVLPLTPDFLKDTDDRQSSGAASHDPASDPPNAEPLAPTPQIIELYASDANSTATGDQGSETQAVVSDRRPQPGIRPRLSPELLTGPQMKSNGGRVRRGTLALDASFSEFGEYEQQFYSALQAGWYQEIDFFQPIDTATRVVIQFVLQADGVIRDIEVLSSNASRIASLLCQNALSKRSPYRVWTREMVDTFGEARQMRVVFNYR
jgi:hypothetical protein